ncbi:hypothetical protein RGU70_17520 [Herbaspirillum sp. RTI4]|uniref:hypothetical protein n=1 Tax=Herbaspirillum sp. RTI4 TaxID=3048640 RepID=UPI002AB34248|nr:hypothetical protein [Herbaspirillum sp. RTI4]MDY7580112.1 hypothetical protein [Herbaspirillum sp. RTI4]
MNLFCYHKHARPQQTISQPTSPLSAIQFFSWLRECPEGQIPAAFPVLLRQEFAVLRVLLVSAWVRAVFSDVEQAPFERLLPLSLLSVVLSSVWVVWVISAAVACPARVVHRKSAAGY